MVKAKNKTMYIAVIVKDLSSNVVQRTSYTSEDRDALIAQALKVKGEWERTSNGGLATYRIFVGELFSEITLPIPTPKYQEISL